MTKKINYLINGSIYVIIYAGRANLSDKEELLLKFNYYFIVLL